MRLNDKADERYNSRIFSRVGNLVSDKRFELEIKGAQYVDFLPKIPFESIELEEKILDIEMREIFPNTLLTVHKTPRTARLENYSLFPTGLEENPIILRFKNVPSEWTRSKKDIGFILHTTVGLLKHQHMYASFNFLYS